MNIFLFVRTYYTIPRNNRELQLGNLAQAKKAYYTIPRNNRELQQGNPQRNENTIIPYQEIIGNYSG